MVRSNFCAYGNVDIFVKAVITAEGTNANNQADKILSFDNSDPFRSYIPKINDTFMDNVEDLDIFIPMDNLLEYRNNYQKDVLQWYYYRNVINDEANENNDYNYVTRNRKKATSKSFEYNAKIIGSTPDDKNIQQPDKLWPLWRFLILTLTNWNNCEKQFDFSLQKNWIM